MDPSPRAPEALLPQHRTAPVESRAHVCSSPAAMAFTGFARPVTLTGALRCMVVPSPSCPWRLSPQQRTAPAPLIAHAWRAPTAIALAVDPGTVTSVVLFPSSRVEASLLVSSAVDPSA